MCLYMRWTSILSSTMSTNASANATWCPGNNDFSDTCICLKKVPINLSNNVCFIFYIVNRDGSRDLVPVHARHFRIICHFICIF